MDVPPSIQPATNDDLEHLLKLYAELNPDDRPLAITKARNLFATLQHLPSSTILIAKSDNTIASTCTLMVLPNLTRGDRPYALTENMVMAKKYRKRGFGEATIKSAIDLAWKLDCYKVMLMTGSKNPATHRFYERCGFEASKTGFQIRNGIATNNRSED